MLQLMGNRFIKGKLHMNFKYKWTIPLLLLVALGLVGCSGKQGKEATNAQQDKQVLSGVYKTDDKYSKRDDGTLQPDYWYFKKNGKLLYCTPQVNSTNQNSDTDFWYGDASRGTWKSLGNDEFEIKMHDVYDNDYYTIKAKLNGNKLHTYANSRNAKYEWSADVSTKQSSMTYSDFMDMFNKAKDSDQKGIQESGYTKPNNDSSSNGSNNSSSNSDSDSSSTSADPDEIGKAVYARVFPSEQVDSVEQDGDSYYVSNEYHSADSTVKFQINGDTVTYWTQADGDTTADGKNDAHTVSIKDLLGN